MSAQNRTSLEFCLAWDMPKITFGAREKEHSRSVRRMLLASEDPAVTCGVFLFVFFQEIHALLRKQRRRSPPAEPPRSNAIRRVGEEHRGVAEARLTGQVLL